MCHLYTCVNMCCYYTTEYSLIEDNERHVCVRVYVFMAQCHSLDWIYKDIRNRNTTQLCSAGDGKQFNKTSRWEKRTLSKLLLIATHLIAFVVLISLSYHLDEYTDISDFYYIIFRISVRNEGWKEFTVDC